MNAYALEAVYGITAMFWLVAGSIFFAVAGHWDLVGFLFPAVICFVISGFLSIMATEARHRARGIRSG